MQRQKNRTQIFVCNTLEFRQLEFSQVYFFRSLFSFSPFILLFANKCRLKWLQFIQRPLSENCPYKTSEGGLKVSK